MPPAPAHRFSALRRRPLVATLSVAVVVVVVALVVVLVAVRPHREPADATGPGHLQGSTPLAAGLPANTRGWRILYTTTDATGRRVTASAIVVVPDGGPSPHPVLSVGHGTTGIHTACAPSLFPGHVDLEAPAAVGPLVAQGWAVVQTDYIGLGVAGPHGVHPYLDGPSEAHAVLDATRAAGELDGVRLSNRTLVFGLSQGGHAALFTGALAPTYAPQLEVIGVVAAAPASDLSGLVKALGGSVAGLVIEADLAVSWQATHPEAPIRTEVSDWSAARAISSGCGGTGTTVAGRYRSVAPLFGPAAHAGTIGELLAQNTPTQRIEAPVLLAQGLSDPIISPAVQRQYVAARCAAGQHLDFREYPGRTHTSLTAPGSAFIPDFLAWAQDRLSGDPATPTC